MKIVFTSGLVAGIAMLATMMLIVNPIFMWFFPEFQGIYEDTTIFRAMDDPLMSLFFLYPIATAFALAWVWDKTKHLFSGDMWRDGLNFGIVYFFVAGVPAFFINYASFDFPFMMVMSWVVTSLVNGVVGGWVLAKMNRA